MNNNNTLKGVFLVGLGATSYGMLATFVKLAYAEGYTTAEVTASQFILGILGMLCVGFYHQFRNGITQNPTRKEILQLMTAGTSLGMTSVFYYMAVRYIEVSIAIVLLMQTVWMGVILEYLLDKVVPSFQKIISVIIVLVGTALATNLFKTELHLDWRGLLWGLLAAASFTTTMFTANRIASHIVPHKRSLFMLMGGGIIVALFGFATQFGPYYFEWAEALFSGINEQNIIRAIDIDIFWKWGVVIALFGTIIPPLLMNAGFPHTGLGLGSIVSSIELPVSVMMAFVILDEQVVLTQWIGIALILTAIVIMNVKVKDYFHRN